MPLSLPSGHSTSTVLGTGPPGGSCVEGREEENDWSAQVTAKVASVGLTPPGMLRTGLPHCVCWVAGGGDREYSHKEEWT